MVKKNHPIFTDNERLEILRELRCVSFAMIVNDPGSYKAIELVSPDIYVKGKEYIVEDGDIIFIRFSV